MQVALKYGFSLFGLPKTGQTTVYKTGDDGTYQKGYPKSGARFVDNDDGTVTDKATGLMWVKDGTGLGCNNGNTLNWSNSIIFCEDLNFAGHTDWRLPNAPELLSILDYLNTLPAVDPLFINTKLDVYFTSTTFCAFTNYVHLVDFGDGTAYMFKKSDKHYLRPVRGG
jgi:hypothetical protein